MPQVRMTVDGEENTGILDLLVSGQVETTYSYEAGVGFVLSERANPATLSVTALEDNYALISRWLASVKSYCTGFNQDPVDYSEELEYEGEAIKFKLKVGGVEVIDAEFDKETGEFTFQPRDELTLTAYEFDVFARFLGRMLQIVDQ